MVSTIPDKQAFYGAICIMTLSSISNHLLPKRKEASIESKGAAQLQVSSTQLMGVHNVPITSCIKLSKLFDNTKERRKRVSSAHQEKLKTMT